MPEAKELIELNKKYGANSLFKLDDKKEITDVKVLSTGSLALNIALGVGGFPRGRVVEIYGPEGSGKTLLTLTTISATQKAGGNCAFIDVEHALDPTFARLLGVDTSTLYYAQPDSGDIALNLMQDTIKSGYFDIVVLDSVAGLVTEDELANPIGTTGAAGATARLMSMALKVMTPTISTTKTVAIFINQLREKPMVMYGSPEYTPGGRALKFYASIRIDARKRQVEKEGIKEVGHLVECKITKNKVAPPFGRCHIKLSYTKGIDHLHDTIETGKELGLIIQQGSWFHYSDLKFNGNLELYAMDWTTQDKLLKEIQGRITK